MRNLFMMGLIVLMASVSYAQDQLTINLDKPATGIVRLPGITSYFLSDETLVDAVVASDNNSLIITPRHMGSTLLLLWSQEGRRSYRLRVERPQYMRMSRALVNEDPGFKVGVSMGQKTGISASDVTANIYKYTSDYVVVDGYGSTPLGFFQTQLGYKVRQEDTGTTQELSNLKVSVEKDKTRFQFGDQTISYSDYVMPYQDMQGLSFSSSSLVPNANMSLFLGVNHAGWWGEDTYRDPRDKQNFLGGNILYSVNKKFSVGVNAISRTEPGYDPALVAATYGKYVLTQNWTTSGELAFANDKKAIKAALSYDDKSLNISSAYRLTSAGYRTASDYSGYSGYRGLFTSAFYRYDEHFSFSGKVDFYKNVDNSGTYNNQDLNATTYYTYGSYALTHSFWAQDRGGYAGAGVGRGQNFEAAYLADALRSKLYYRYTPTTYRDHENSLNNYDNSAQTAGFQFNGIYHTSLVLEKQWNERHAQIDSQYSYPQIYRVYFNLPQIALYQNKLNGSFYARYQESYSASNNVVQNESFVRARLDWKEAADQKFYLEYALTNIASDEALALDRTLTEVSFGTTYFFDTGINLTPGRGMVKGNVFLDVNGNGFKDADEAGVPGVRLNIGDNNIVITDANGDYTCANLKGSGITVSIDQQKLPKGYIFTTVPDRVVNFDTDNQGGADFGLSSKSMIVGMVFVDQNANALYDPGEPLVPDVRFEVKDVGAATSDLSGLFVVTGIPSGPQTLIVDIHTIPVEYAPSGQLSQELNIVPGEKYQVYFPLKSGR